MSSNDTDLINEFVIESLEHLEDIEDKLLAIEGQAESIDLPKVNEVFRAIHSIKGAAGFLGFHTLERLTHRGEEILNKLRSKEIQPKSLVINALLRSVDRIKLLLDSIESSNDIDITEQLKMLSDILDSTIPGAADRSTRDNDALPSDSSEVVRESQPSEDVLQVFIRECGVNLGLVEQDLLLIKEECEDNASFDRILLNICNIKNSSDVFGYCNLATLAQTIEDSLVLVRDKGLPSPKSLVIVLLECLDVIRSMLHALECKDPTVAIDSEDYILRIRQFHDEASQGMDKTPQSSATGSVILESSQSHEPPREEQALTTNETASATSCAGPNSTSDRDCLKSEPASKPATDSKFQESSIRVDIAILDSLMTCVGELVLARNQILQHSSRSTDGILQQSAQRLNMITSELQEYVMKTRMQPIGTVWSKFPRLVRDLALICGKQVRIEMVGKETELDKTIIEAVKDPLTHLVRNTVDHGIEDPNKRIEKGKLPEGCLYLRAYHEGGLVNIEIADDGAGLDLARIREKALERALVAPDVLARMSDRELAQLIFLPGFSTADKVSNISGRGVGMDVVKTNIEKIGGSVDLETQCNLGTTIRIKIPLTLAIIPAIIVLDNERRYAIPQVNLVELLRLEGQQEVQKVEWIQGAPVYRLRGKLIPLVFLSEALGTCDGQTSPNIESLNIVILKAEDHHYGLVVGRIVDSEEIVVKPLSKQLKGLTAYSGATIMGDGKVALILDIIGLAKRSGVLSANPKSNTVDLLDKKSSNRIESQALLVVKVNEQERCAIPLSQITRLEKIDPKRIEMSNQNEVIQYRNRILPLIRLDRVLGTSGSFERDSELDVIVYTSEGQSVGVIVHQVVDIAEMPFNTDERSMQRRSFGRVILLEQVTELLDLPSLISLAN